jgi:hypothetical protein
LIFKARGKNVEMPYTEEKRKEQVYHGADKVGMEARSCPNPAKQHHNFLKIEMSLKLPKSAGVR